MILRVGRGQVRPGGWEPLEEIYGRVSERPPPGIRARLLVRDLDDENGAFTLGLWDGDEALSEWLASEAFAGVQDDLRPYFEAGYQVHTCEVRVYNELDPG